MNFPAGFFGRSVVGLCLGVALVAGAGTVPVAADDSLPPVAAPAPGSELAAQAAAALSGRDVVVDAATSPTEVTVAHPDGTFTRSVHAEPVRMQTSSGWRDISTDLVRVSVDGREVLKPAMAPVEVSLGTAGTDVMAVVDDGRGHSVTQSWPFGDLPTPVVDGDAATYANVLPGVDLVQIAHPTGVSQVLRIASAAAARDPRVVRMRLFLDAHRVSVSAAGDGGLQARGTDTGAVELRTAAGQWWDSSQPGASAADPGGPGITRPFSLGLGVEGGQQTQVFGMGQVLDTPGIVYPIFVDPDWSASRASYLYVDSGYASTSYWNGQYADDTGHVGFLPAAWAPDGINHVTRTFYQFTTSPLAGKVILSARMDAVETWASSCTPRAVSAWVTGGVGGGTTWNAQPGWLQKVSTQTVAKGYPGCAQGTVSFDMGSAKGWLANSPQWTVGLRAENEGDSLGWKRFTNNPVMSVSYDTPPSTPTIWSISGGLWNGPAWGAGSTYVTRFNTPKYYVKAGDPDGVAGGNISVTFTVKTAAGAVKSTSPPMSGSPAAGTMFSWQGGALADGKYVLYAQAKDQQGQVSGTMSFAFTVDTTPPPAPVITAVTAALNNATHTDNAGTVGDSAYTLSLAKGAGANSYDVEGFVYAVTDGSSPVPTYPGKLACGTREKEFVVVCATSASITVAPINLRTQVTVWSFDTAGNIGTQVKSEPVNFSFGVGHEHPMPATTVPVTLAGGASWVNITLAGGTPTGNGCTGTVPDDPGNPDIGRALQFTGTGAYAQTAAGAVDTSGSFSMSGWVCASTPAKAAGQSLITQLAGAGSPGAGLSLDTAGVLGLDQWTGTGGAGKETAIAKGLSPKTWYFVAAVSDRINRQLRITVGTGGPYTATWTVATASATHLAAPATAPVILGAAGPGGVGQFTGRIFQPVVTAGVLTDFQFTQAQQQYGLNVGVKK